MPRYDLGCGNSPAEGFVGVDADENSKALLIQDISRLTSIPDGSAEELRAYHCLEHFPEVRVLEILSLWYRKLSPSGKLTVCSPDVEFAWRCHFEGHYPDNPEGDWRTLRLMIGDDQLATPYMIHKTMFWPRRMIRCFQSAGFVNVKHIGDFGENCVVEGYK